MDDIRLPSFTLRYHSSDVTALQFIDLRPDRAVPGLLSGDASGQIALWDVIIRRPLMTQAIEGSSEIVSIQVIDDNLIAILSKDHKMRIFRLLKATTSIIRPQQGSPKQSSNYELQECYHIPINTLNFANFLVRKLGDSFYRLICCNTQNSESIDIYTFHLSDLHSLCRIHKGINFYDHVKPLAANFDSSKVNKLGIVMKFAQRDEITYCGFESGYIIGFRLCENSDPKNRNENIHGYVANTIEVVYVSAVHYPNPVLDLYAGKHAVLSSSVDDVIGIHQIDVDFKRQQKDRYLSEMNESVVCREDLVLKGDVSRKVPLSQVGHVIEIEDYLILASWSGNTIVVDSTGMVHMKFLKSKSNVLVNESPQGSLQEDNQLHKKQSSCIKVCSIAGISKCHLAEDLSTILSLGQRRRIKHFTSACWCLIGYADGSIAVQHL
ncbi:hypothetical protein HG535_0A01900 [Zygotorulaspora mrakii]|uniref:ASTRA-associated protein 1 n=1 Tax=Zygotorulaspora mrakii TaxID=42260 RepID=A0A7H9AXE0_ZYGMR|nr:uncharacterized protein HG535_0A01900 [Zygotorulaspora mrakii]QLG70252.1 hypothetical protein HG535_0A01900 [Zygotorulaspora mrakii]